MTTMQAEQKRAASLSAARLKKYCSSDQNQNRKQQKGKKMNILTTLAEKISSIESLGIFIEEVRIIDRYKLMDENPMTLTGTPRPAGEYFMASIDVLIVVDQPKEESVLFEQIRNYPTVQDVSGCKKKNNVDVDVPLMVKKAVKKVSKKGK
jgi:hypothetical protein